MADERALAERVWGVIEGSARRLGMRLRLGVGRYLPGHARSASGAVAAAAPPSRRLEENLYEHDVQGEKAIAVAQGFICCFVLAMHHVTRLRNGDEMVNPWVVLILGALIMSSALRLLLTHQRRLPYRTLDVLNVVDIAIFLCLIWSSQFVFQYPAGGVLKAPAFALLCALVGLRALRSHWRPVVLAGTTAVAGWMLMIFLAIWREGSGAITTSYVDYLTSFHILAAAELQRLVGLAGLVVILALATRNARRILGQAAHASDYAEALAAAEHNLAAATAAREKAETAFAALDAREAELMEQNRRFNAALANMSPGLCMFDSEQRLLVCNERYTEMYGLPPELTRRGTTFRSIIEHRIASGKYHGDNPEEYLSERLAAVDEAEPNVKIHELSDGRVIAIKHQPMEHGGWVATHEDITQIRRIEARISHMARHDALTDLPNRAQLRERMDDCLYGSREGALAVIVLNLDRFKEVNDTLGHSVGDTLLQCVAERLVQRLADADMVARLGGDEFAVLAHGEQPAEQALAIAKSIQEVIGEPFDVDGRHLAVGVSIGIAVSPHDGDSSDQLLKNADLALDRAKRSGGGTTSFFEQAMDERMQARRGLEQDLRPALANEEFELHYQPQLNLERNEISGFEALIRWQHPLRGRISPADFITLAEETGLIVPIGEWVMRKACMEAAGWPGNIKVAVNLSAVQLRAGTVLQTVVGALAASGLAPARLELEVTESVLLDESNTVLDTLERLHDIGVRIALDDFGTGYSSLSYLRRFKFDKLKIDRSFVAELSDDDDDALAIVRTVAGLGTSLGIPTTAEGAETQEQVNLLRREGYTEIQGYLVSRPVPPVEVPGLIARYRAAPREPTQDVA